MNLELTEEQNMLADMFARFFGNESTSDRIRAAEPSGYDQPLWEQLVELGTPAIRVAEEHGGNGMSLREITLVSEQAGYHAAPAPIVDCSVAAKLLSDIGTDLAVEWLSKILNGSTIVSIALQPISYSAEQVISNGAIADAVIALDGEALILIPTGQNRISGSKNLGSQPVARWNLKANNHLILAEGQIAVDTYCAAREEWKLLAASQMKGLCDRSLAYAAEYCNEREAFGVKIGTFQGLSHPLAEGLSAVEGIHMIVQYAIWKVEQGHEDAHAFTAMAFLWATEAVHQTMPWCIQAFGGIGVSEEHDVQLYVRRGMALASTLGDCQQEAATVSNRLWGGESCALPSSGGSEIDLDLGAQADAMRKRTREAFEEILTDEYDDFRVHSWDGYHPKLYKELAKAKLLFPQWSREYGGLDASDEELAAIDEVFNENFVTAYPQQTTRIVGEMTLKFGSDKLKQEVLPKIISGDALGCFGLSEPGCGSDVFSAQTRAVKKGDTWIINGQKMWTSGGHVASYVILLTNTAPELPKHVGKTIFLVPMNLPGIEVQEVHTISGDRTNMSFYTDVEVSDEYRLGEVNDAANTLGYMLSLEQGGNSMAHELKGMTEAAVDWALNTKRNGEPAFTDPLIKAQLGKVITLFYVAEAIGKRAQHDGIKGISQRHYGSLIKSFSTEAWKKGGAELMKMVGSDVLFSGQSGLGLIEGGWRAALASTIYAGTTQVHLSVIAEKGLGLPRSRAL